MGSLTDAVLLCTGWAPSVQAGGGPENVLLVVNPRRSDSLTVANHYVSLRQIPPSNILYLDWDGSVETITVETFRTRFLEPIFAEIDRRRLQRQIDYIVYSTGYPYAVDFSADEKERTDHGGTRGSLTGLTYLSPFGRMRDTSYVFSTPLSSAATTTTGRRLRVSAVPLAGRETGQLVPGGGMNYYLSTMLGYTDGRGNTVDEIVSYLRRAALADGTQPAGTIYLMRIEGEVRSSHTRRRLSADRDDAAAGRRASRGAWTACCRPAKTTSWAS